MKQLFAFLPIVLLSSCGDTDNNKTAEAVSDPAVNKLSKLNWVLGNWYMETPDGIILEHWDKANDTLYSGFSIMTTAKGDTAFSEHIRLTLEGGSLWYIPTVSNQNEGEAVRFKEKAVTADEVVFENPQHDFPQRIIYHRVNDSTIVATIEGMQNGKMRKEDFNYRKR